MFYQIWPDDPTLFHTVSAAPLFGCGSPLLAMWLSRGGGACLVSQHGTCPATAVQTRFPRDLERENGTACMRAPPERVIPQSEELWLGFWQRPALVASPICARSRCICGAVQATWMYRAAKASYDDPLNAEQYFKDMQVRTARPLHGFTPPTAPQLPAQRPCWILSPVSLSPPLRG